MISLVNGMEMVAVRMSHLFVQVTLTLVAPWDIETTHINDTVIASLDLLRERFRHLY